MEKKGRRGFHLLCEEDGEDGGLVVMVESAIQVVKELEKGCELDVKWERIGSYFLAFFFRGVAHPNHPPPN